MDANILIISWTTWGQACLFLGGFFIGLFFILLIKTWVGIGKKGREFLLFA